MHPMFPKPDQIAFIVGDTETAVRHWTRRHGVGPFFVAERLTMPNLTYRGVPSEPVVTLSIAYWGDMQVELIEQHNDAPSAYRDFYLEHGDGFQHMACFSDDVDSDVDRCLAAGMTIQMDGLSPFDRVTRVTYLESDGPIGTVFELVQSTPVKLERFAEMRKISAAWDGADPMREFP